jgi:multimeric flavodoxin WrbA
MHAPPKPNYPVLQPNDLANYDGFILGIPTRFGNMPAQFKVRIYFLSFCFHRARTGFCRPSGMAPASSGNRASYTASPLVCLSRQVAPVVARRQLSFQPSRPWLIMASITFPLAMRLPLDS